MAPALVDVTVAPVVGQAVAEFFARQRAAMFEALAREAAASAVAVLTVAPRGHQAGEPALSTAVGCRDDVDGGQQPKAGNNERAVGAGALAATF